MIFTAILLGQSLTFGLYEFERLVAFYGSSSLLLYKLHERVIVFVNIPLFFVVLNVL